MKRLFAAFAVATVALAPMAAQAGTVDVSGFSGASATISNVYYNGDTTAGSVTISDVQGLPPLANGSSFISFCVDLQHTIGVPVNNQQASLDVMSNWNGYGAFSTLDNRGRYAAYLYNTNAGTAAPGDQQAGLALAIWNALYDTDFTVTAPPAAAFSATSSAGAITAANGYLQNLQANLAVAATHDAYWIRTVDDNNGGVQDFIGPRVVPEPASMLLLGLGLIGAAGAARRRSSK